MGEKTIIADAALAHGDTVNNALCADNKRLADFIWKAGIIAALLLVWELFSRFSLVNPVFLPPFSAVFLNTFKMFAEGEIAFHLYHSLFRALAGFVIAAGIGIPLGFLIAAGGIRLRLATETLTEILAQVNPFILLHLLVLFMGIGEGAKVTVVFWSCLWPIVFNTIAGVVDADSLLIKAGRGFGSGRLELFRKIIFPASSPKIFAGLRLAAGYSVFLLIAAEMMGGRSGLGWLIMNCQETYQIQNVFSIALIIAALGLVIDSVMEIVQNKLIKADLQGYVNSSNN
jgi:NitT/TauT family transport system permease protein